MPEISIISLRELSKPATVLIEKISEAVGGIFKPYQIIYDVKMTSTTGMVSTSAH